MRTSICLLALLVAASAALAAPTYEPRQAFSETDTDGNGEVDRGEFRVRTIDVFYAADANKDTVLGSEELTVLPGAASLRAGDTDRDGRLDLDEFIRIREIEFESADGDDSGTLSVTEVIEAWEPRK